MMQRAETSSLRVRGQHSSYITSIKSTTVTRPFVSPQYLDMPRDNKAIYVTYGDIHDWIRSLTPGLTAWERRCIIESRRIFRYDNREIQVRLLHVAHTSRGDRSGVKGGSLWYRDRYGSGTLLDVKGLFFRPWADTSAAFKTENLAEIMEHTRESLESIGLRPQSSASWHKNASITKRLFKDLDVHTPTRQFVPIATPSALQAWYAFGDISDSVFIYDINQAYNAILATIPEYSRLAHKYWDSRMELKSRKDPAERVLKVGGSVTPGLLASDQADFANFSLARYIWSVCRKWIEDAITLVIAAGGIVYRAHTDGFIASLDISSQLDIGTDLGQWRVEEKPYLTIAETNVYFAGDKIATSGLPVTRADIQANPCCTVQQEYIDWRGDLEIHHRPYTFRNIDQHSYCRSDNWHMTPAGIELLRGPVEENWWT